MGCPLFLHDYFPALYFAILLSPCAIFALIMSTLRSCIRLQIGAVLIILVIWNFQHLSPLVYGNPWTKSKCVQVKWLKDFSWCLISPSDCFRCSQQRFVWCLHWLFSLQYSQYDMIALALRHLKNQPVPFFPPSVKMAACPFLSSERMLEVSSTNPWPLLS